MTTQAYNPASEGSHDTDQELERLYSAITGRAAFSYSPSADPMYRGYADRYIQNGRMAMRDTVGQSAALTGGYGSSYAQSAGQQQYDEYLRSLGEVLPELYGLAWQQYDAQGEALQNAYDMNWQRRESDYQRGRDALADQRYESERQAQAEQQARQQAYKQQQDSYARLYKLIASTGYQPTDTELNQAGLSRAQAEALRYEYLRANKLLPAATAAQPAAYGGSKSAKSTKSGKTAGTGGSVLSPVGPAISAGLGVVKAAKAGGR